MISPVFRLYGICALVLVFSGCAATRNMTCSGVHSLEDSGWYRRHMMAAGAAPLCATDSPEKGRYRFVWLRSFHNPIVIDLVKTRDKIVLKAVRLGGAGGYQPGKVVERRSAALTHEEFEYFESLIEKMDFWNLRSAEQLAEETGDMVLDGAIWILEGAVHNKAHAADRSIVPDDLFREAALFLLEKSKIDPNGDIY